MEANAEAYMRAYEKAVEQERVMFDELHDALGRALDIAEARWDIEYAYDYCLGVLGRWKEEDGDLAELRAERRKKLNHKKPIPATLRWEVWERDDFTCRHCGTRRNLSCDHIHPESKGGEATLDNLQTLCRSCNSAKGDR